MHIIDTPSGRFMFVGRGIPGSLLYVAKDGSPATDEALSNAARFGPAPAGVKSCSFATREEAEAAAAALGLKVEAS